MRGQLHRCSRILPRINNRDKAVPFAVSKGKAIPVQAYYRPTGLKKVEVPRFIDIWHMKAIRLSLLRTGRLYRPCNVPGTQGCKRMSQSQGLGCGRKDYVNENRTRDLPVCCAAPQPPAPPRAPLHFCNACLNMILATLPANPRGSIHPGIPTKTFRHISMVSPTPWTPCCMHTWWQDNDLHTATFTYASVAVHTPKTWVSIV